MHLFRASLLLLALAVAGCDTADAPAIAGRYAGGPFVVSFDVPFTGTACDRAYTDARRVTVGQISRLELTLTERDGRLAGQSLVEYDHLTRVRQADLPDCSLGGNSSGGYDSVRVERRGDHLTTDQIVFAERAELDLTPTGLSGTLVVGADWRDVFGDVPDLPVVLRRLPGS